MQRFFGPVFCEAESVDPDHRKRRPVGGVEARGADDGVDGDVFALRGDETLGVDVVDLVRHDCRVRRNQGFEVSRPGRVSATSASVIDQRRGGGGGRRGGCVHQAQTFEDIERYYVSLSLTNMGPTQTCDTQQGTLESDAPTGPHHH